MVEILPRAQGSSIAYARSPGIAGHAGTEEHPGLIFMGGFMSDMSGAKAAWLASFASERGLPYLRFDYSGHGASGGNFVEGTIGGWLGDSLAVFDELSEGPQILIGSSMGGWLALLVAIALPQRVQGFVGIAAAPDFTEKLIRNELTPEQYKLLMGKGIVYIDTPYGDKPYAFTRELIEDGRSHLLLDSPIDLNCPVRLIHGYADADVPWETSLAIMEQLKSTDCSLTLIKDGNHRLSRAQDLTKIGAAVMEIIKGPGIAGARIL